MYYNTAVRGRRRRHGARQVPQAPHPEPRQFWEKFYFRPGNLGYPVFDTAVGRVGVYICYDRHFPEGWRELGLNGAHIVFNPNATKPGLSNRLWEIEQPAAAVANGYFVLQPNRVGREDNEYGDRRRRLLRHQPGRRSARQLRRRASARGEHEEILIRDLDLDVVQQMRDDWQFYRDRRPELLHEPDRPDASEHDADQERHGRQLDRHRTAADVLIDGETIVGGAGARARRCSASNRANVDTVIDATGKYVIPGGIDAHTHMEMPFGGTVRLATRSRPARAPRPGAARPRSSTSSCSTPARTIMDQYALWHEKAAGNCAIDYGFHQIISRRAG